MGHLRTKGSVPSLDPEYATGAVISDLQRVLPDGPWKALTPERADGWLGRCGCDERGAVLL